MNCFPVRNLPDIPLTLVFENFELDELFNISLCSKKLRSIVKEFTSLQKTRIPLYIQFGSHSHLVSFDHYWYYREPGFPPLFKFYNRRQKDSPDVNFDDPRVFRIDNTTFKFGKSQYDNVVCVCEHPEVEALVLAEYLFDTFSAELIRLEIDKNSIGNSDAIMESPFLRESKYLRISNNFVVGKELRMFLGDFETEVLDLWCDSTEGFVYEKPISFPELHIVNATFFSRQNLLELDCFRATIKSRLLVSTDINDFLHQWLRKEDDKLEYLLISKWKSWEMDVILEGIVTIPGSRKKKEATSVSRRYDRSFPFENGVDIRRQSDGKLMTVLIQNDSWLNIVVWLDPNPFL